MTAPLIYHGERVREEAEKEGKEMEKSKELREAFKLIGKSFKVGKRFILCLVTFFFEFPVWS